VFIDPSLLEEAVADGTVTVVMNPHHEICAMLDLGGIPRSREQVSQTSVAIWLLVL